MINLVCGLYDLTVSVGQQVIQVIQRRWIFVFKSVQKSLLNSAILESAIFECFPEFFKLLPHFKMEINGLLEFFNRKFIRKCNFIPILMQLPYYFTQHWPNV